MDNDAARQGLIAGYSPSAASARLIGETWAADVSANALLWYARVASPSNPADAPSRMEWSRVACELGDVVRSEPVLPASWTTNRYHVRDNWFTEVFGMVACAVDAGA